MANEDREIVLKLSIDGQEAISTIKLTDEEVKKLRSTTSETFTKAQGYVQNLGKDFDGVNVSIKELMERHSDLQAKLKSENIGGEAYQRWAKEIGIVEQELDKARVKIQASSLANEGLIQETLKYTQVNEDSVKSISEFISSQNLSTETIQNSIRALDLEINTLAVNSDAWKQKTAASVNLRSALANLTAGQFGYNQSVKTGLPGISQMNMAIMQTGYVMNDAQMFLVNFRMGMMGISNNIPMIIDLFRRASNEAKGMGISVKDILVKSLTGAGGLMLAINGVMFLMQILPDLFSNTTQSIEDQKKAVDQLRDAYAKLTKAELENRLTSYQTQLGELEAKYPVSKVPLGRGQYAGTVLREQTPEERFGDDLARVNSLQQQINLLKELVRDRGIEEDKTKQIAQWREKIEVMNDNPDSKNYWKNLVTDATSYEDAIKKLNNAIDQYQKKTKKPEKTKQEKIPTAQELFVKEMEKTLPSSVFEALQPLAQEEPQMLPDVKLMDEQQLEKLRISNIEDRFTREKQLADWELQNELLKYQSFANFEEIRTKLEKQNAIKRKEIANEEANYKLNAYLQTLDILRGAFAEHTAIAQAASIASTIIQTYQAATAALSPPPIGAGPLLGPILAAATIAAGMANIAKMESVKIPGYAEGGRLPKGESGFIEGYHNEIIAPEKTFVEVFRNELRPQIYNSGGMDSNSIIDLKKTNDEMRNLLIDLRDNGIKANAYLDDREAKKIRSRGNYLNNKTKLG